jgi:predicted RNA-binding protein YlqC (UPF0109 family)
MTPRKKTASQPDPIETVTALMRDLVSAYTRHHEALRITAERMGPSIGITLQAHKDDHPRLVGARGAHIWALQCIFAFIGARLGRPVKVTLMEPWTGEKMPLRGYEEKPDWDEKPMLALLGRIVGAIVGNNVRTEAVSNGGMTNILVQTPDWSELMTKHQLGLALHQLFHAIGKLEGRIVHVEIVDEHGRAMNLLAHVPAAPSGAMD